MHASHQPTHFHGVYSVLPTPFDPSGDVHEPSLRRVVQLFLKAGVDGVTALGVTAEVARLDDRERALILDVVLDEVGGRVPVICGTTAEGTRTCIAYSRRAVSAGAAAVMVSPPRLPALNTDAVMRHFHSVPEAIDADIVVQDFPPVSGYTLEPTLLARIAAEIPRARTIKLEDPPTPTKTALIRTADRWMPRLVMPSIACSHGCASPDRQSAHHLFLDPHAPTKRPPMAVMRAALLAASTNNWLREHAVRRRCVRRSVSRFMPGEHLDDAIGAVQEQKKAGVSTILTHLGENLASVTEAEEVSLHYINVLERVAAEGLDAQIAVKPTQLGLDYEFALCQRNIDRLTAIAGEKGNFV